jgi:hypothetical protein
MPKRIRNTRPSDINQAAYLMVERSTADEPMERPKAKRKVSAEISRVMSAMGRIGGKKGGKARLVTMTAEERSQAAMKAAQARWAKKK